MDKTNLIEHIAEAADLPKTIAGRVLDAALDGIAAALGAGDTVTLRNFGTFLRLEVAAGEGRNPRTGEKIAIARHFRAKFKPAAALRERLDATAAAAAPQRQAAE